MISPHSWWCSLAATAALALVTLPVVVLGVSAWVRIERRVGLPEAFGLLAALACTALAGYATYWGYVAHPLAGRAVSWSLLGITAVLVGWPAERRRLGACLARPDVALPAVLVVGSACFVLTWYLAFVPSPLPAGWTWINHAFARIWIPDSTLPLLVAGKLHDGIPLHTGFLAAGSTGRPPLQAGLVLVQYPLWDLLARARPDATTMLYQTLGTLLQSFWVAGAWALLRQLGFGRSRAAWLLVALVPSHFFVLNSAYVWPKLLAASFVLGAFALLLLRPAHAPSLGVAHATVAATFASLGLIAHPGVGPSLIGLVLLLLVPRFFPGWRSIAPALLAGGLVAGPWLAYQRLFQPIEFSLAKQFLAGVRPDDPRSLGELLRETYTRRPLAAVVAEKWEAVRMLAGFDPPPPQSFWEGIRRAHRATLLPCLGVLNVSWVIWLVGALRGPPAWVATRPLLGRTLAVSLLWIAVSILVLFESGILRHTSYATIALMFLGLGAAVTTLPPAASTTVLVVHVLVSLVVFSAQLEPGPFTYAGPTLAFALAVYAVLLGTIAALTVRPEGQCAANWIEVGDAGSLDDSRGLVDEARKLFQR